MSVSRWGANNQAPRAPALHRRLASQQRADRFLTVSISALQKAREKARLFPVGCYGAWWNDAPHNPRGRASSL